MNHHKTMQASVGSVTNKHNPSTESGLGACISSRITTVIHVRNDHQVNNNCFKEPFADSPIWNLFWDMHGLIFETSIWLLAGSTRFLTWTAKPTLRYWHRRRPAGQDNATNDRSQREVLGDEPPARHSKPRRWRKTSETRAYQLFDCSSPLTLALVMHVLVEHTPFIQPFSLPKGTNAPASRLAWTLCVLKQVVSTEPASNRHWCSASRSLQRLRCQPFSGSRPPNPTTYLPKTTETTASTATSEETVLTLAPCRPGPGGGTTPGVVWRGVVWRGVAGFG